MRPKSLVRDSEITRIVNLAKNLGLTIGALDVRIDGVTIHPVATPQVESAYARWKNSIKDKASDRPAHS